MNTRNGTSIGTSPTFTTLETKQQFLQAQLELYREIREGNKTWKDMNEFRMQYGYPDTNTDSLRRSFTQLGDYDENAWLSPTAEGALSSQDDRSIISTNYDRGETTSEKIITLSPLELNSPSALLLAHGFNPDTFELKSSTIAKTQRANPRGAAQSYSSRIVVKPRNPLNITTSDVDEYFSTHKFPAPLKISPKQYDANGEFLEVCLQDLHMGLLSYEPETGEDYDVYIAEERVKHCLADIMQRCKGRKFKRIVLALIGDILHTDNAEGTTTKGTRQDVDTRPSKMFDYALTLLITLVEQLGSIAPVEVVTMAGNHDYLSAHFLYRALEQSFRSDKNVTFFTDPNPRKWRRYGNVLIGYAHGDMKPNAVTEWLSNECPEWSQARFREVHLGHLHSLQTIQKIESNNYGLIARYLPALCGSSAWEHQMGFPKSQRGMMSFVWNEETGLREIWYSNI